MTDMTVLAAFAVWKVTATLLDYDGPLNAIKWVREAIAEADDTRTLLNFECFFCMSTIVALPAAVLLAEGWAIPIMWFGLAGMAWFLNVISERLDV